MLGRGADDPDLAVLAALHALAANLDIEVRTEPFALSIVGRGGMCRIRGRRVVLVDAKMPVLEQIGVLGEALGPVLPPDLDVPDGLAPYLRTGHAKVGALLRPRPLARARGSPSR